MKTYDQRAFYIAAPDCGISSPLKFELFWCWVLFLNLSWKSFSFKKSIWHFSFFIFVSVLFLLFLFSFLLILILLYPIFIIIIIIIIIVIIIIIIDTESIKARRRLDTVRKASWLVVLANHERSFVVVMKSTWRASGKKWVSILIIFTYLFLALRFQTHRTSSS